VRPKEVARVLDLDGPETVKLAALGRSDRCFWRFLTGNLHEGWTSHEASERLAGARIADPKTSSLEPGGRSLVEIRRGDPAGRGSHMRQRRRARLLRTLPAFLLPGLLILVLVAHVALAQDGELTDNAEAPDQVVLEPSPQPSIEPTPSPLPTVTASSTPTPSAAGPTPVLSNVVRDDFADAAVGLLPRTSLEPDGYVVEYTNGEYVMRLADPQWATRFPALALLTQTYQDTSLAADVRLVGDPRDKYLALGCRSRATGQYRLTVFPAGRTMAFERWDGGDRWTGLAPVRRVDAILPDNATNRLELSCIGSSITATINGTVVAAVQDSTYSEGLSWIALGSPTGAAAEARWDNLILSHSAGAPVANITSVPTLDPGPRPHALPAPRPTVGPQPPRDTVSRFFVTTLAGFTAQEPSGTEPWTFAYLISLAPEPSLPSNAYIEAHFENPRDTLSESALVGRRVPDSSIAFETDSLTSIRCRNYYIEVHVYTDASKSVELGTHVQWIYSGFDSERVRTRSDLLDRRSC
jgi:hypothetical protein